MSHSKNFHNKIISIMGFNMNKLCNIISVSGVNNVGIYGKQCHIRVAPHYPMNVIADVSC